MAAPTAPADAAIARLEGGTTAAENWGYGRKPAQIVAGIFKEWRKAGPKADIEPEKLAYCVDFEFAPKDNPTRRLLEDACQRLPYIEPKKKKLGKDGAEEKPKADPDVAFDQGQFVEFLGDNMMWQLAKIRRVVRVPRADSEDMDNPDYDVFYNIGSAKLLPPSRLRAPEEGLKLIFGFGPWVFQQWAVLQVESLTRFQENHELDMDQGSFEKVARDLWEYWLSKNPDFAAQVEEVEKEYPGTRDKLLDHIMSPFTLMDEIIADHERWDVGDQSLYTYISFLGSGWGTGIIVFFIQMIVPVLLLVAAVNLSALPLLNSNWSGQDRFYAGEPFVTNWTTFCSQVGTYPQAPSDIQWIPSGKIMNITVLLLYLIRVLPMLMDEFLKTAGEGDDPSSRLNDLREVVWDQGDDTVWQQMGYKLGKYMNSLYVAVLMTLMLFILFLTNDIFNLILNALALEFVHTLDEETAASEWYDPDLRWMRAGVLEMLMRGVLRLDCLEDPELFCIEFDVPHEDYKKAMMSVKAPQVSRTVAGRFVERITADDDDQYMYPLCDYEQGREDAQNPKLMSKKMRYYAQAAEYAKNKGNKLALENFAETVVGFGFFDRVAIWLGLLDTGVFARFKSFYIWSRWHGLLTVSRRAKEGERIDSTGTKRRTWHYDSMRLYSNRVEAMGGDGKKSVHSGNSSLGKLTELSAGEAAAEARERLKKLLSGAETGDNYLNFFPNSDDSSFSRFLDDFRGTVLFGETVKSVRVAVRRKKYAAIPFRVIDS